jgi:hypothetical protein
MVMKQPMVAFPTQLLLAIRSRFTRRARLEAEALRSKKMREDAHYFRVFCRERRNRGLLGGARWIRTSGAARASMGGIRTELGALFGPTKKHPCWREFVRLGFGSTSDLSGSLRSPG